MRSAVDMAKNRRKSASRVGLGISRADREVNPSQSLTHAMPGKMRKLLRAMNREACRQRHEIKSPL
jgi:hypothetical protein